MESENEKPYEKKVIVPLGIVVLLIAVTLIYISNKGVISDVQLEDVYNGMSVKDIEKELGNPKSISTDNSKISQDAYADYKALSELNSMLSNEDLQRRMNQLDKVYTASESGENVTQYVYVNNKHDVEIYFIGGAVSYINRVENEK